MELEGGGGWGAKKERPEGNFRQLLSPDGPGPRRRARVAAQLDAMEDREAEAFSAKVRPLFRGSHPQNPLAFCCS